MKKGQLKENATQAAGQQRAHRLYPVMGNCELCDKPAVDIHHKDRNRLNNNRDNLMFLCRHHHMEVDGRLKTLQINGTAFNSNKPSVSCFNCGTHTRSSRNGRCHACNEYFRRNGKDRGIVFTLEGEIQKKCVDCGQGFRYYRNSNRCQPCAILRRQQQHTLAERLRRKRCHDSQHGIRDMMA